MPKKLVEAALFMASKPLQTEQISKITGVPLKEAQKILEELRKDYEKNAKGIEIIYMPDGWQMRVKPEILPKVAHLTPYSDLREGHKRTLALVAYKEPIKQSEIVKIQGNKAYNYIKFLRKKGLIKTEKEGRTIKISLTKEFERYLGIERSKIKEILQKEMERGEKITAKEKSMVKTDLTKFSSSDRTKETVILDNTPTNIPKPLFIDKNDVATKQSLENSNDSIKISKELIKEKTDENATKIKISETPKLSKKFSRRKKIPPAARIGTKRPK